MRPIAVFYHCLFAFGEPPEVSPHAFAVVQEQVNRAHHSGLMSAASHFAAGVNGGEESDGYIGMCFPDTVQVIKHGLESRCENPTIREIEKWVPSHPGWNVLYFHAKGATHPPNDALRSNWRNCMMRHLVDKWRRCVSDLENGYDSVGCHWLTGQAQDRSQNIWAGNFWWAKSEFLATLPSMLLRDRIKQSGLSSLESRFESEVWIGNGPRLPTVKDYHPDHPMRKRCH